MKFEKLWKLHGKKPCNKCNNPDVYAIVPKKQGMPAPNDPYWKTNRRKFRTNHVVLCQSCLNNTDLVKEQLYSDLINLQYSGLDPIEDYEQLLADRQSLMESNLD